MLIYRQLACSTTDCPCQKGPQSPEYAPQFCPLYSSAPSTVLPPLQFFPLYSSAPSSKKQGRITVPRAWSTVLPHLQRSQTAALAPWGNMEDLVKTTTFIQTTALTICGRTTLEYSRTVSNCNHSIHQANPKQIHPLTHSPRTRCLYN